MEIPDLCLVSSLVSAKHKWSTRSNSFVPLLGSTRVLFSKQVFIPDEQERGTNAREQSTGKREGREQRSWAFTGEKKEHERRKGKDIWAKSVSSSFAQTREEGGGGGFSRRRDSSGTLHLRRFPFHSPVAVRGLDAVRGVSDRGGIGQGGDQTDDADNDQKSSWHRGFLEGGFTPADWASPRVPTPRPPRTCSGLAGSTARRVSLSHPAREQQHAAESLDDRPTDWYAWRATYEHSF